jgi:hypothetical protein
MDLLICAISNNNQPSFVDYQYECFKKYVKGKFEYILFDNSDNSTEFKRHCDYIGAFYVKVQKDSSNKELSNFILNNVYNLMKFRGAMIICNLDTFLIDNFEPSNRLTNCDIISTNDRKDIFIENDFLLVNLQKLNLTVDSINNIRPSMLQDYIKKSKDLSFKIINMSDFESLNGCKIYEDIFLKYNKISNVDILFGFLCERLINWNLQNDPNNKYLITYSLFGDNPRYTYNAVMNALIAQKIYKGWICRFYYDETVPQNIINVLALLDNVELVKNERDLTLATFWRFFPASEPDVAVVISRDSDAWPSFREAYQVKKWVESDKMFHIIRDHCHHTEHIMAGMFGIKRGKVSNFKSLCHQYVENKANYYGIDQHFLKGFIYPLVTDSAMIQTTGGHSRDTNAPFEGYPKILEYIPGIDIEKTNDINSFNCSSCNKTHSFFIGIQLFNIHNATKELLSKYGL